ncbi:hypothetical protein TrRE_jg3133 [Triparma retinervis]|uniref:Uncharacterized protein n=1 Tax=Triparma retinervis TaxID=2557542 RepID=A0A9W7DT47_9STRA|nr:hypothetical protein TrRE_jg3133 [Triparma retinervis]
MIHTTPFTPLSSSSKFRGEDKSYQLGVRVGPLFSVKDRRNALISVGAFLAAPILASPSMAGALDMDAFVAGELAADKKACNPKYDPKCVPELTKDEALCQYGQSGGKDRSEACRRVKEAKGK